MDKTQDFAKNMYKTWNVNIYILFLYWDFYSGFVLLKF